MSASEHAADRAPRHSVQRLRHCQGSDYRFLRGTAESTNSTVPKLCLDANSVSTVTIRFAACAAMRGSSEPACSSTRLVPVVRRTATSNRACKFVAVRARTSEANAADWAYAINWVYACTFAGKFTRAAEYSRFAHPTTAMHRINATQRGFGRFLMANDQTEPPPEKL